VTCDPTKPVLRSRAIDDGMAAICSHCEQRIVWRDQAWWHLAPRGWWDMVCWNGLSAEQQQRLIEVGNLPMGYLPTGSCVRGAEVAIETDHDVAPGPRFYCRPCAIDYLRDEGPLGVGT
jgi:hypothetical protein